MPVDRVAIPNKARNRDAVPWRLSVGRELTSDEMVAIAGVFLEDTKFHYVIQGNVYPGLTMIDGDYWASKGHGKDLSQVARRWDEVQDRFPELIVDAVLEYRVPGALLDEAPAQEVIDLTS